MTNEINKILRLAECEDFKPKPKFCILLKAVSRHVFKSCDIINSSQTGEHVIPIPNLRSGIRCDTLRKSHENRSCQNLWYLTISTTRSQFMLITYTIKTKRANPVEWICPYWKDDVTRILKPWYYRMQYAVNTGFGLKVSSVNREFFGYRKKIMAI